MFVESDTTPGLHCRDCRMRLFGKYYTGRERHCEVLVNNHGHYSD